MPSLKKSPGPHLRETGAFWEERIRVLLAASTAASPTAAAAAHAATTAPAHAGTVSTSGSAAAHDTGTATAAATARSAARTLERAPPATPSEVTGPATGVSALANDRRANPDRAATGITAAEIPSPFDSWTVRRPA
jgi:hypothetical protein